MSPGPIPVSKIREHAPRIGITEMALKRLVRSMDAEYLEHVSAKQNEK